MKRQNGFTLLEIMIAFVVFSLTFSIAIQIVTRSLSASLRSADYSKAVFWAQSHFALLGNQYPIDIGHSTGHFDDIYFWEQQITAYDVLANNMEDDESSQQKAVAVPTQLLHIKLTVFWKHGKHSLVLTTLKAVLREAQTNE